MINNRSQIKKWLGVGIFCFGAMLAAVPVVIAVCGFLIAADNDEDRH